ncbi:MAG: phosphohistidine phosphatase SixA [Betaproteobacteria bacterium]|nr:MAG: phosphohistidine phosphatase SixA [Betaproteobacteria bacterium]
MDLILWRHAEAEDGSVDMQRALTAKGQRQAAQMAAWLKRRLPATAHILVSPALRTQQTAQALALPFETVAEIAPGAGPDAVLRQALVYCSMAEVDANEGTATVLIVGHQPTLGFLAASLLVGQPTALSVRKGEALWLRLNMPRSYETTPVDRPSHADQLTATLMAAMTPALV